MTFDLKKRAAVATGGVVGLLVLLAWGLFAYQASSKYEEVRREFNQMTFNVSELTDLERKKLTSIADTWELRRRDIMSDKEERLFTIAEYSPDVEGLVRFWRDRMPPFSLTDQDANELWVARAALRELYFPERFPTYATADGILFASNSRYAVIIEDTSSGFTYSAYTPKPIIEQGSGGDP